MQNDATKFQAQAQVSVNIVRNMISGWMDMSSLPDVNPSASSAEQ